MTKTTLKPLSQRSNRTLQSRDFSGLRWIAGARAKARVTAAAMLLFAGTPFLMASDCEYEHDEDGDLVFAPNDSEQEGGFETDIETEISATPWLRTEGNRIVQEDGTPWLGRGVNIHDTRGCNACTGQSPNVDEVKRRIDEAVDVWGADFLRLNMESYGRGGPNSDPITRDGAYFDDIIELVTYIGTKPGVYVLLSLWHDPTFTSMGWPTPATAETWEILTVALQGQSHVMFGLVNEPQNNQDGARNAEVWRAMNDTVARIRSVEEGLDHPERVIAVQGTRMWARCLAYYVENPIQAGDGVNIVYETHVYNRAADFGEIFEGPAEVLPVIIGEFGPWDRSPMTLADTEELMERAEAAGVPYLAWTFHMRCAPNLLVDHSDRTCGVDMPLEPTAWGRQLMERLARPAPRQG